MLQSVFVHQKQTSKLVCDCPNCGISTYLVSYLPFDNWINLFSHWNKSGICFAIFNLFFCSSKNYLSLNCFGTALTSVYTNNKTGLQPVSRPVEWVHYLRGGVGVQSPFEAIAVQTVTLLAMHVYHLNAGRTIFWMYFVLPFFSLYRWVKMLRCWIR